MFQSTRPWGRERASAQGRVNAFLFQSTRPWGREPAALRLWLRCSRFNPRARGGANVQCALQMRSRLFQSTRPWGRERSTSMNA